MQPRLPLRALVRTFLRTTTLAALLAPLAHLAPAAAQDFPNKPIRLVNPFPPGTTTSMISRLISDRLQAQTGQPVIVDHKPGAGTNLGSDLVAKAAPDGYTILMGTSSLAINPALYRNMPLDPLRDLTPIVQLATSPNVLAVNTAMPVNNVREFLEHARRNPGKLNYASSGNGATNHLGMELFKSLGKVDLVHIPFKGGTEALASLLGSQTDAMFSPPSTVGPQARAGKLRIIGVGSPTRIPGIDAAPIADTLPGFESLVWYGLFAPAGTPAAVIARLNREVNTALGDKSVQDPMIGGGFLIIGGSAADMRAVLERDTKRFGDIVRASGAKVD